VTATAFKKGIPNMRMVYVPHPVTDRPAALCRKYLEGKDPISSRLILDEITAGLSMPLSEEDKQEGFLPRPPRTRLLAPDTADNLEKYFYDNDFTDGLPVVLPTEKRVAEMLQATSRKPDEIVGRMAPSTPHEAWEYTVEMVAANAVMSGAKPEFFPAILALASTGQTSLVSSTSSYARMALFNGPIIKEINMNPGVGAMGPFSRANTTIGRCWTLISKNLGGSGKSGETYMGTQGSALNFSNLCFPEAEDALPAGWNPFHVQKGYKKGESVVSVFGGWSLSNICWYTPLPIYQVVRGWLEHFFSTSVGGATLIFDPTVAVDISAAGFKSKEAYAEYLVKNIGTPAWLYWQTRQKELQEAKKGVEPFASYLKAGENGVIPVSRFAEKLTLGVPVNAFGVFPQSPTPIEIIVTGGGTNTYWSGGDFTCSGSVSIDKWR
jgi:hypothetical protein